MPAYDSVTARLAEAAEVDLILVGDSLGNVVLGFENTVPVTLEMMLHHVSAVTRMKPEALVVADVPFSLAHEDFSDLLKNCVRLIQQGGADAVKIEGGAEMAEKISRLVAAGVPVMGHIGLQPQQVMQLGGYRKFGKNDEAKKILDDARAISEAGVFAIVGEGMTNECAAEIQKRVPAPLIGIGSGNDCDGQILVIHDILGLSKELPKFAKPFVNLASAATDALCAYKNSVKNKALY